MRLKSLVNKQTPEYGKGITFFDIDNTIFHTKALIYVIGGGKVIKKLSNQEFNTYKLQMGESFDFREFRDAELFKRTSTPIPSIIKRIKRISQHAYRRGSRVVLLTARADFDNRDVFLSAFSDVGIPINDIYVERTGNMKTGTIPQRKEQVILKYIKDGDYRRVRLIDDDMANIKGFIKTMNNIDPKIIVKVKEKHNITDGEDINPIETYALLVIDEKGKLKRIQ